MNLVRAIHDKERFNHNIGKDHVDTLSQFEIEERRMQEENEAIRQENTQMRE